LDAANQLIQFRNRHIPAEAHATGGFFVVRNQSTAMEGRT